MKVYDMRDLPDDDGIREPIGWARVFTPRRMWLIAGVALLVIVASSRGADAEARRAAVAAAQGVVDSAIGMIR